jgi:hypothetical protein
VPGRARPGWQARAAAGGDRGKIESAAFVFSDNTSAQALSRHVAGGTTTAAAKEGWPQITTDERDFVAAGLRRLGDPDRRRALSGRLYPGDLLSRIVRKFAA